MRRALILAAVLVFISGCSMTTQQRIDTAYKSLLTSAQVYKTSMSIAADLDKAGMITSEEKKMIITVGMAYYSAWHTARLAVEVWYVTQSAEDADKAVAALKAAMERFAEFVEVLKPILERGGYKIGE